MNPFAAAAQLLGNLAGLGQQFAFVNDPKARNGEYIAGMATATAGDAGALAGLITGKTVLKERLLSDAAIRERMGRLEISEKEAREFVDDFKDWEEPARNEAQARKDAWGGSVIAVIMALVDGFELLAGFGPPEEGDAVRAGSQQFTVLSGQLGSGVPDANWQGAASVTYAHQATALQQLALALAELDTELATVIKDYAGSVTHVRLGFGILKDLLALAVAAELQMRLSGPEGPPAAMKFAMAVSVIGIWVALAMLAWLTYVSLERGDQANEVTSQYTDKADSAVQGGASFKPTQLAAAVQSSFGSVEALCESVSAISVLDAEVGSVRTPDDSGLVSTQALPGIVPMVPMPNLAQLRAWPARSTMAFGPEPEQMNRVNQTTGPLRLLAPSGRPDPAMPAPHDAADRKDAQSGPRAGDAAGTRIPSTDPDSHQEQRPDAAEYHG